MKSELKARLARLGQTPAIGRVSSGLPADLVLRPADGLGKGLASVQTISAISALAHRGVPLLKAKRAIEAMVETGEAVVHVPMVEDAKALDRALRAAGVRAARIGSATADVKAIRTALGLTQEAFAIRYGLDVAAVQNWEQGRNQPDRATGAYLRAIAAKPREVAQALEEAV